MSDETPAKDGALLRTPLFGEHARLGARLAPFGGWEMPIDYGSIIEEHHATRRAAGLFDLSHMGEFFVSGPGALDLIGALITNDPTLLPPGQGQYSLMCRDDGTIVDDVIVYHLPNQEQPSYLIVVNAANISKDWAWLTSVAAHEGLRDRVQLEDRSPETGLIAIQGPLAEAILQQVVVDPLSTLGSFAIREILVAGILCLVARTGYTGEDGFEILVPTRYAQSLWSLLLNLGQGLRPVGLGARDTLRLEARLPLYGNDIDDAGTPLEAGLGRFVKLEKPAFHGKEALLRQKQDGLQRKLVGLAMDDRSIPRAHYAVLNGDGEQVGEITSGSFSPTLGHGIALAYVPPAYSAVGTTLQVQIRGQAHPASITRTPFYRRNG